MRQSLVGGFSTSCGCQNLARFIERNRTHDKTHVPEYGHWAHMKDRCTNQNNSEFHNYGGRGIKVCQRWHDFEAFYADMGPRPGPEYSLDRYPNQDGHYEPGNVRWATCGEQQNNRRDCLDVPYNNETQTLSQWSRALGIPKSTLWHRLVKLQWSPERAFTTPVKADILLSYGGKTQSIPQWAQEGGMNEATLRHRIVTLGWSLEDSLNAPLTHSRSGNRAHYVTFQGRRKTLAQWAVETGIDASTLYKRIVRAGWPPERAFTTANGRRRHGPITYGGKTQYLGEWARDLGLDRGVLHARIYQCGWTAERAFTTPVQART